MRDTNDGPLVTALTALPGDTHLAYCDRREAWYARPGERPEINISASAKGSGGGVAWEFGVAEYELGAGRPSIRLRMFDDAFAAFGQIPGFFAALTEREVASLDDVIELLRDMGAADETARENPY